MRSKKWYKVYGSYLGIEYLLGTIFSLGNAYVFARAMNESYMNVRID